MQAAAGWATVTAGRISKWDAHGYGAGSRRRGRGAGPAALRLYELATGEEDARLCRDIPEAQCHEQPHNFVHQVTAQALSKIGDALVDGKVVLPWLLGALGAPPRWSG